MSDTKITVEYAGPWKVKLTYFNNNGKFKYTGKYISKKIHLFEIWDELEEMLKQGKRPGLIDGPDEFYILIKVPHHPHNHPHLHIPKGR